MQRLNISLLSMIVLSAFLIAIEGQATILTSPLRRQRIHRGLRALRITSPPSSEIDNEIHLEKLENIIPETTTTEWLNQEGSDAGNFDPQAAIQGSSKASQSVGKTRAIVLKQLRREKANRNRLGVDKTRLNSDAQISNDHDSRSPWWSRGKQGLQWRRNKDTGVPEVVELED